MIKWVVILGTVILYSVMLFFPFVDFSLLIKYNMPDGCAFVESDVYRVTDNLVMIAYGGYYLSVILIVFVMMKFNSKKSNDQIKQSK